MSSPAPLRGRVQEKRLLTPKIFHVRVALEDGAELSFRAGQFIQILIAPRVLREYSMCSPPVSRAEIELCVDISPAGEGSRYVQNLAVGAVIQFRGPFGVFTVPEGEQRPVEFIATGAGIAPIRSMIFEFATRPTPPPSRLLFGNRSQAHLPYTADFERMTKSAAWFTYVPALSRPVGVWEGERGRVTEVLARWDDLAGRTFYICGGPKMVDDTRRVLTDRGVPTRDVHFEKFT